ncbi:MAG: thioredoxin reductase, partial [Tenericutes bacterium HGW-Tenericutes-6]
MNKVVIIGYGPAGITAAIYLKRAGIDPLVIGKDLGALDGYSSLVENYYGLSEPIEGRKLIKQGDDQAKKLGIKIITDSVISLKQEDSHFIIVTEKGKYTSESVLLATGKTRQTLNIPGFNTYRGKG